MILVTGGDRSGKSAFAEDLAKKANGNVLYIATAKVTDEEMEHRILKHKQRRPEYWDTLESYINLAEKIKNAEDKYCCILVFIGNGNKQCGCYHFTYTVLTVRMGVVLYGRTSYVIDNILTFLRFSRNDYYSICLDYCNISNFEQIIKAPHMLCQALWCFNI